MYPRGDYMHTNTIDANGMALPILGQGGWFMGDSPGKAGTEAQALRTGVALGLTLIDTAEIYGNGRSEALVGRAVRELPRESFQLVSKVHPENAGRQHIFQSCAASLKRLQTDYLDLYLLHWRGNVPLRETVACMEELVAQGKIRRWGVSNFDVEDMQELLETPGGENCAVDQVLYHLGSRGNEYALLPLLAARGIGVMAYCPLAQAGAVSRTGRGLLRHPLLTQTAAGYGATAAQLLLAFLWRRPGVMAIPKAASLEHVRENAAARELRISEEDWARLDAAFPPPDRRVPLDVE